MHILKSTWTPWLLRTFIFIGVVVELGAMWEQDHFTHAMAAGLVFVSVACLVIMNIVKAIIKKGATNAQAD